jgi:hypothetical protein
MGFWASVGRKWSTLYPSNSSAIKGEWHETIRDENRPYSAVGNITKTRQQRVENLMSNIP